MKALWSLLAVLIFVHLRLDALKHPVSVEPNSLDLFAPLNALVLDAVKDGIYAAVLAALIVGLIKLVWDGWRH